MPNELGTRLIELEGYYGHTFPVSEGRLELISEVFQKIEREREKYAHKPDIPRDAVGRMRRMQMEVMVDFKDKVPNGVYESKDFPLSLMNDLRAFFLMNANPV